MKKHFLVYQHLRKDTGCVFYVGKGTARRAITKTGRNKHWNNVVAKADGFSVEIVFDDLSESEAFTLEKMLIASYRKAGIKLTNITDGGEGVSGYKHSESMKKHIAQKSKGNKSRTGQKALKEQIVKMLTTRAGYKHSTETKRKQGTAVYCKTNGITYATQSEAAVALGIHSSAVSMCCKGKQKSTKNGFEFEYATGESKRQYIKKGSLCH